LCYKQVPGSVLDFNQCTSIAFKMPSRVVGVCSSNKWYKHKYLTDYMGELRKCLFSFELSLDKLHCTVEVGVWLPADKMSIYYIFIFISSRQTAKNVQKEDPHANMD